MYEFQSEKEGDLILSDIKGDVLEDWRGMDDQKKVKKAKKKTTTTKSTTDTKTTEEIEDLEDEVGHQTHDFKI